VNLCRALRLIVSWAQSWRLVAVGVTQKLLGGLHVLTHCDQERGQSPPKGVPADPLVNIRGLGTRLDDLRRDLGAENSAVN
jgi:hypothetical protein